MNKQLPSYQEYERPNGQPFAALGITVFSYKDVNTRRRRCSIDGLPLGWPKTKCAVCSGQKRSGIVCRSCYDDIHRIMVPLTCCYCGSHFERIVSEVDKQHRRGHTDVYCSKACSEAHHAVKNRRRCLVCGIPTPKKTMKYCSKACKASQRTKDLALKLCSVCGVEFQPKSSRTKYCSRTCANKAHSRRMRGSGNSHYKSGTSYANWFRLMRPIILKRDKHACVACGKTKKLIVHHVNHVPKQNEAHNLITLCATCHAIHHKSKVSPFPWLKKLALGRAMSNRMKIKCIELEAKYSVHVYDIYRH